MCRDVKLLYDVTADTIGYIPVQVDAASLRLAMVQLRSITLHMCFACEKIINSLRSKLVLAC